MNFMDLMPILFPGIFLAFIVLERLVPARTQPRVGWWLAKGILFFVAGSALNASVPAFVLEAIGDHSLLHLTGLGTFGGAAVVLLFSDFVGYWIHRGLHNSELVWRWTHQLHHSAERMDMAGAAYFHPFDMLAQQVIPSIAIVLVLGVTPMAAAVGGFAGFVFGVAPHMNVRTPSWLGYFFQRPEMHAVHHERGVHAYNYGVLALSDLVFGTWRNPRAFPAGDFGFWDGASANVGRMLLGRDVTRRDALDRAVDIATTAARSTS
jgi:sterol desaturase/sphingolipid hydroxylase (fatty acid hydroxylase superfamily)